MRQVAEDGVVLQQMRQSFRIRQVVDCDELKIRIVKRGAQNVAANASETVDTDFDCHECLQKWL
jgi:hypothetical protein